MITIWKKAIFLLVLVD